MRYNFRRRSIMTFAALLPFSLFYIMNLVFAGQVPVVNKPEFKSQFHDQNERCFRCHGSSKYTYMNSSNGKEVTGIMFKNRLISRTEFYTANHKSFACIDCHAAEYDTFPHPGELRMEDKYNCIDCHRYDEKYAKYHFEEIENEFRQSIHYAANPDAFTCWKCHNPHSYKISIRNSKNIIQSVAYDNQICLNCHSDFEQFQLLTDKKETDIHKKHEWLPNQELHFSQARCIECHARPHDSLLVAHLIMPKEKAVKRCVECHSQNSLLINTLYKYQSKENRTKAGFRNSIILNQGFIIGANRNIWLNKISLIVFTVIIMLILIHLTLRMKTKKNN